MSDDIWYNIRMTVFVTAMPGEAQTVLGNMTEVVQSEACGKKIYSGRLCGRPTAVVVTDVGKVNAACGAQYAIDALNADKIINIGVAGGLNEHTSVGQIYGISHVVQYDFDLAQLNGTTIGTLNEFAEPYLTLAKTEIYELRRLGTGDRFNDSAADYSLLTHDLKADIRDMECGAIAQVCAHAGVRLYAFKCISDVAGSGSTTEQYMKNLEHCFKELTSAVPAIFEGVENE